jgi:hypothetical protein
MGVYPKPFLERMEVSVTELIERVETRRVAAAPPPPAVIIAPARAAAGASD